MDCGGRTAGAAGSSDGVFGGGFAAGAVES